MIAQRKIDTFADVAADDGPAEIAPDADPGRLGRYDLIELIGRGGTSTVYRALDFDRLDRDGQPKEIALKLIRADGRADPDLVRSLHIEARRLVDLAHPNIVRVFGSGHHGEHHFLVMELLSGRTLAAVLKDRPGEPLDPPIVFRLVREIAIGLAHAHGRGFVHGDLKPGNVFLTEAGHVKLLDFGTARPLDATPTDDPDDSVFVIDRLGAVTPAYASPETLSGEAPSEGDDVFSLAVMTYLMLTGAHPFGPSSILDARQDGRAAPRARQVPRRRAEALAAALTLDATARNRNLHSFVHGFAGPDLIERLLS